MKMTESFNRVGVHVTQAIAEAGCSRQTHGGQWNHTQLMLSQWKPVECPRHAMITWLALGIIDTLIQTNKYLFGLIYSPKGKSILGLWSPCVFRWKDFMQWGKKGNASFTRWPRNNYQTKLLSTGCQSPTRILHDDREDHSPCSFMPPKLVYRLLELTK